MIHQWPILAEESVGSRQWIFDRVVEHHRKQRARCPEQGICYYRSGARKCFIGAIIDDADYRPEMEVRRVATLVRTFNLPSWFQRNVEFLAEIQSLHDCEANWPSSRMDRVLARFAKENGLRMP